MDRVVVREGLEARLADSIETVLDLSDGLLIAENADTAEHHLFGQVCLPSIRLYDRGN